MFAGMIEVVTVSLRILNGHPKTQEPRRRPRLLNEPEDANLGYRRRAQASFGDSFPPLHIRISGEEIHSTRTFSLIDTDNPRHPRLHGSWSLNAQSTDDLARVRCLVWDQGQTRLGSANTVRTG